MASHGPPNGSSMFSIRFSESDPRDMQLLAWIREDTQNRTTNVSGTIKELLYAWYVLRIQLNRLPIPKVIDIYETPALPAPRENGHRALAEGHEDPRDPLVQNLLGLSFEDY